MMSEEYVFPQITTEMKEGYNRPMETDHYGLTKRELFAGMAMQALLSATDSNGEWTGPGAAAEVAVDEADKLIAALEANNVR